jgi:hypothetical protein
MIEVEVLCDNRSDRAEADDPESAIIAGRNLYREIWESRLGAFPVTTIFRVDGLVVATMKGRRP